MKIQAQNKSGKVLEDYIGLQVNNNSKKNDNGVTAPTEEALAVSQIEKPVSEPVLEPYLETLVTPRDRCYLKQ